MKRSTPMRRTAFKSKALVQRPVKTIDYTPRPRDVAVAVHAVARAMVAAPKENILQHRGYMALVRLLPCARCRCYYPGLMQFAHADILGFGGKGRGIKSDCRLGWPGCAECHRIVGSTGRMPKAQRHDFEARAGFETRSTIYSRGLWPASLPLWHDLEKNHAEENHRTETEAIPA